MVKYVKSVEKLVRSAYKKSGNTRGRQIDMGSANGYKVSVYTSVEHGLKPTEVVIALQRKGELLVKITQTVTSRQQAQEYAVNDELWRSGVTAKLNHVGGTSQYDINAILTVMALTNYTLFKQELRVVNGKVVIVDK